MVNLYHYFSTKGKIMKKLLLTAAMGFAVTSVAAQSVTISGSLHGSVDQFSVAKAGATRTGNKSETRITDNVSRVIFRAQENLSSDLQAVGQFDLRFSLDAAVRYGPNDLPTATQSHPISNPMTSGNNHIGLVSKQWGALRLGRQDLHYVESASFNPAAATILVNSTNMLHSVGTTAIANWSRTPNLIWYTSPSIAGLSATVGYSTNPSRTSGGYMEQENDMATGQRSGSGTYLRLGYDLRGLNLVYSQWLSKSDWINSGNLSAGANANALAQNMTDRDGKIVTAKYAVTKNISVGLARAENVSRVTAVANNGQETKQNATQLGLGFNSGAHSLAFTHTRKDDLTVGGVKSVDTAADQNTLVYGYALSPRTSVSVGYVVLNNKAKANNSLFYNSENAMGSYGSLALAGEKHSAWSVGLRHSF